MGELPSSDMYDTVYVQSLKHINIEQLHTYNQPPRGDSMYNLSRKQQNLDVSLPYP